jgi:hypothetical protein
MRIYWVVEQRWSRRGLGAWQGARRPNWGGAACPARLDMATGLGCKSEACGRERQACESVGMSTYWVKKQRWSRRGLGACRGLGAQNNPLIDSLYMGCRRSERDVWHCTDVPVAASN